MSRQFPSNASRSRFMIGKYEIVAQPIAGSAQMRRYTVYVNRKRIGAMASVPTESDCRFLEDPPPVPPVKPHQAYYRPGRPKKGAQPPRAAVERTAGLTREELPAGLSLPALDRAPD